MTTNHTDHLIVRWWSVNLEQSSHDSHNNQNQGQDEHWRHRIRCL